MQIQVFLYCVVTLVSGSVKVEIATNGNDSSV